MLWAMLVRSRFVDGADLEHRVDEEAEALLGRGAAGGGVRGGDEAEILEIGHHVAHRGGREARVEEPAQIARSDRDARLEVALDELPENVLAAGVEHREEVFRGFHRIPINLDGFTIYAKTGAGESDPALVRPAGQG